MCLARAPRAHVALQCNLAQALCTLPRWMTSTPPLKLFIHDVLTYVTCMMFWNVRCMMFWNVTCTMHFYNCINCNMCVCVRICQQMCTHWDMNVPAQERMCKVCSGFRVVQQVPQADSSGSISAAVASLFWLLGNRYQAQLQLPRVATQGFRRFPQRSICM